MVRTPDSGCGYAAGPAGISSDSGVTLTEAFPMFGLSELAIILIVVIAVIAVKKGPELARTAGKSARIMKAEARAAREGRTEPQVIQGEVLRPGAGGGTEQGSGAR